MMKEIVTLNVRHWVLAIMVLLSNGVVAADSGWVSLFDGKTLNGWVQKNGTATYRVENGTIVGKTSDGSPNSFLCSEKDYADFDFEFEVKVDNRLNSGVQIRSQTVGGTNEGRVNGPQVEIEAGGADGAEAGYIYGESAGGWMTPEKKLVPHKHFKDGQWNAYRVLAVGPRIRVWINGMLISDLVDMDKFESHRRGFIGLQVHGIGRNEGPYEVAWRNLRLREMDTATSSWKQLYNGKDLDGWQTTGNWKPQADGSLLIQPRAGELGWQRYSDYIWSNRRYSDFVLEVEYKYPAKGNSGVYFRVDDISNPVESGIEAQILDNSEDTRAMTQHDHGGIISTAAPSRNMSKKPGEWNKMVVTCYGSFLQVTLNGEKIIDIELDKSAAKDKPMDGYIGLQDHGQPNNIHFRNIRILEL
ncbi:MAG: DUF1080 domain-containing protein [Verrucomicrobia bacterium]|nr:DUF1080 domain-containing protein [Verrucomicrobiota bacterium]